MKAPDKIYLQTCGECPGLECDTCRFEELGEVSWCEDRIYETDKEYIRKDALLEWAKEKLKNLKVLLDTDPYKEAYIGKCEVYKELMDKLNSL